MERMNKETELYYYPKMYYKDNKEYFYWIDYDVWFTPCGYSDFFEWIEKHLQTGNRISLLCMVDVQREDKVEEKREWEKYNSIYKKEYFKIREVIENPNKLKIEYGIEYEFIL